jgi:hypothetical protein
MFSIFRRLFDLALVQEQISQSFFHEFPITNSYLPECVICCSETSHLILPCCHRLCESCEERWVRSKLACPFCRKKYSSFRQIEMNTWHLTEFSNEDLDHDINHLRHQLRTFWNEKKCYVGDGNFCIDIYEKVPRSTEMCDDDDFVTIMKNCF